MGGIMIIVYFISTIEIDVFGVKAIFGKRNIYDIQEFEFIIAVPKCIKLQIKPADGTVSRKKCGN